MNAAKLSLIIVLFLWVNLLFAQNIDVRAFLVKNKRVYKSVKKDDFSLDSVLIKHRLPELSNAFIIDPSTYSGNSESCILLFFFENGEQVIPDENEELETLSLSFLAPSEIKNRKPGERPSLRSSKRVKLFTLAPIHKKILARKLIQIELTFGPMDERTKLQYSVFYSSFPAVQKIAVERWQKAYEYDFMRPESKQYDIHEMVRSLRVPMHLGKPWYKYNNEPTPGLSPLEGGEGFILEGNFSMPFTVMQGREDQNKFIRNASGVFDPEFTWRINQNAESSPLLPLNTKLGFFVQNADIIGKHHHKRTPKPDEPLKGSAWENAKASDPLFLANYSLEFMHYSNGQRELATVSDSSSRVDFGGGNFSTNFFKGQIDFIRLDGDHRILSASIAFRYDFGVDGLAEFETHQKKEFGGYGQHRINTFFQYRSGVKIRKWPFRMRNRIMDHRDLNINDGNRNIKVASLAEKVWRLDLEYITEDVDNKRLSGSLSHYIYPLRHRAAGYFVRVNFGRDPLNIRYNLRGIGLTLGVSYDLSRVRPPLSLVRDRLKKAHQNLSRT